MDDTVQPALTADEWADYPNWPLAARPDGESPPLYFPTRHGIAAANLHGQPYGFTHEMVNKLIDLANLVDPDCIEDLVENAKLVADRIAALLPTESTP